ncbi:MAG: MFS transporter, partial [Bacteroidota bacterium]
NVVMTIVAMFLIDRLGRKPLLIIGSLGITLSLGIVGISFMMADYKITEESIQQIRIEIAESRDEEKAEMVVESLGEMLNIEYKKESMFFKQVKVIIGSENYNLHKEQILKHSITISSIWVLIGLILFVASFAISLGPVMWALLSEIFPNRLRGLAISIVGFWNSIVSFSVATVFPIQLEHLGSSVTYLIFAFFGFMTFLFVLRFIPETKGRSLEELEERLVRK